VPGFALRFSDYPDRLNLEAPLLGEHNEEVLRGYLGYPLKQIRELEQKGVLRNGPV
jgi:crotonobetainyl-CoA:carnitine CoA-transferase CaiB-like acyl-CoA transferase